MIRKWLNKQTITAFIIGILMTITAPVYGAVKQYIFTDSNCKLFVNGKEYANPDIPQILYMYENRNYAPLAVIRDLCLQLGVEFTYDNKTKEIHINIPTKTSFKYIDSKTVSKIQPMPTYELEDSMEWVWFSERDFTDWTIKYNDCIYINEFYISNFGYRTTSKFVTDGKTKFKSQRVITNGIKDIPFDLQNINQAIYANNGIYVNLTWLKKEFGD